MPVQNPNRACTETKRISTETERVRTYKKHKEHCNSPAQPNVSLYITKMSLYWIKIVPVQNIVGYPIGVFHLHFEINHYYYIYIYAPET